MAGPEKTKEEQLADMLDKLFSEGGGHVNVTSADIADMFVDTFCSSDGTCRNGACMQPTEHLDKYDNE